MKDRLKKLNIFSQLTSDELDTVIDSFSLYTFDRGDVVVPQDGVDRRLFIVLDGTIDSVLKMPGRVERKQGEFHPGNVFNIVSFFSDRPSLTACIGTLKGEILTMTKDQLHNLMNRDTGIAVQILFHMLNSTVYSFANTSMFLSDILQWGEKASRRVITDEMTGVYNRAFLDDALENFFSISVSNNKPLSLIMMDIDNFRDINEKYGNKTGDSLIKALVALIERNISKHGIIARYGGDEFSILLPEADLARAGSIAENIRSDVEKTDFSSFFGGEAITVTTSLGISSFPETARELAVFREKADASLYQAKKLGRNRVEHVD